MKSFAIYATAACLALGGTFSASAPARAQNLELELGNNGPKVRLRDDCDPRRERCRDDNRRGLSNDDDENDDFDRDARQGRRFCTEDRALDKAERLGIRRAHVVAAGRRVIEIRGRDRNGDRVELTVGRDRNCPVVG